MLYQVIEDGEITQSYSMPDHDDTHHITSAKRDTASGVAGIDASKEMINDVPVSKLVDMDEQSFTNLIENGDFESWSAGTAAVPDGFELIGSTVARSTTRKKGSYSAMFSNGASETGLRITASTIQKAEYSGLPMILGCWVKTDTALLTRLRFVENDGSGVQYTYSGYHTGGGDWEFLSTKRTMRTGLTTLLIDFLNNDGLTPTSVYFDGVILVEGYVCPAFSPKPTSNSDLVFRNITSVNANTTLTDAHYTVNVDAVGGARTITLPPAATNSGRIYNIKKIDASGNAVTIDGAGAETIDGAATQTLAVQWNSYTIQSNGTGWFII